MSRGSGVTLWCMRQIITLLMCAPFALATRAADPTWEKLAPYFSPPAEFREKYGNYRSPLKFEDGTDVSNAKDWARRREEISRKWHAVLGPWPALLDKPAWEVKSQMPREGFVEYSVKVQVAEG